MRVAEPGLLVGRRGVDVAFGLGDVDVDGAEYWGACYRLWEAGGSVRAAEVRGGGEDRTPLGGCGRGSAKEGATSKAKERRRLVGSMIDEGSRWDREEGNDGRYWQDDEVQSQKETENEV